MLPTARPPRSRAGLRAGPRAAPALRRPLPARRAVAEGVAAEPEAPEAPPVPPVALPAPVAHEAAKKALREAAGYALLPPWKRVKRGSCLRINLGGAVTEVKQPAGPLPGGGGGGVCLPEVCDSLVKAAHDTRITGVLLDIAPLGGGWAKLTELRRHIEYFRTSGKVGERGGPPPT